jgi:hypothetical protein
MTGFRKRWKRIRTIRSWLHDLAIAVGQHDDNAELLSYGPVGVTSAFGTASSTDRAPPNGTLLPVYSILGTSTAGDGLSISRRLCPTV